MTCPRLELTTSWVEVWDSPEWAMVVDIISNQWHLLFVNEDERCVAYNHCQLLNRILYQLEADLRKESYVSFPNPYNRLAIWKIKGSNSKWTQPIWNCQCYEKAGSVLFLHGKFYPSQASGYGAVTRNTMWHTSRQKPHHQHESPIHAVCTQGWRQLFTITLRKSEEDIQEL